MLCGHMDTVGVDGMEIDPFNASCCDGKVYGRGAVDMKGGLASIMGAIDALVNSGFQPRGDVVVAGVADEEYASEGMEDLVKRHRADAAIVAEPSGLDIIIAHKGFAWFNVEVLGRRAHGSDYTSGIDAISRAGHVLRAFEDLGQGLLDRPHPLVGPPSIHASIIKGGRELSTYPDHCHVEFERRTVPGETREDIEAEVAQVLSGLEGQGVKTAREVFFFRPGLEVSPGEPIIRSLQGASSSLGREPRLVGQAGWMDTAILARSGIPSVLFGPGGEGLHASVEWVDFAQVLEAARVLAGAVKDFCGG
jgi:acetylornithine deacetylase